MTRPAYHPHPRHFYEDKKQVIHLCDGAQIATFGGPYLVWTLCEKIDVPANQSFMSFHSTANRPDCLEQGKGRKGRVVSLSADVIAALEVCLALRPNMVPNDLFFWNQKRKHCPLSTKGVQKKVERYAKAAGINASCHSLRYTLATNLWEEGAELCRKFS
jgi:integrase